jgi:copper(I)-binding protein
MAGCGGASFKGASKNSDFAKMQGVEKILVPANLKVTLH